MHATFDKEQLNMNFQKEGSGLLFWLKIKDMKNQFHVTDQYV